MGAQFSFWSFFIDFGLLYVKFLANSFKAYEHVYSYVTPSGVIVCVCVCVCVTKEQTTPQADEMVVEETVVNQSIADTLAKHPKAPMMIDVRRKLPLDGLTLESVQKTEPTWKYYV